MKQLAMINSDGKTRPPLSDPPGVVTRLHDLRIRILARTPFEHAFTGLATMAAAEEALAAGADAIYIDTFGDYGIESIRAISDVPVTGAGEASLAVAATTLARFSIVTVWPRSMAYLYEERIAACGVGDACVEVDYVSGEEELNRVGTPDGVKARMKAQDGQIVEALVTASQRAVAQGGSEGVLLGCTCMSPVAEVVADRSGVPVLDPSRIGMARAIASLEEETSLDATPRSAQVGLAGVFVDAYLRARGQRTVTLDECEACVSVDWSSQGPSPTINLLVGHRE